MSPQPKSKKKARPARKAKTTGKGTRRRAKPGIAVFRAILDTDTARPIAGRTAFEGGALAGRSTAAAAAAAEAGPAAANRAFVAAVSHDGPWELRSLVINDFQVLDTTVPSTDRRIDVTIPAAFGDQLSINWAILAGHLIPGVATFVQVDGLPPVKLADKAPLKKGESWAPLAPSTFP